MSVNASNGEATTRHQRSNSRLGGIRTWNKRNIVLTELVSQPPMGWWNAWAYYSTERDGRVE